MHEGRAHGNDLLKAKKCFKSIYFEKRVLRIASFDLVDPGGFEDNEGVEIWSPLIRPISLDSMARDGAHVRYICLFGQASERAVRLARCPSPAGLASLKIGRLNSL